MRQTGSEPMGSLHSVHSSVHTGPTCTLNVKHWLSKLGVTGSIISPQLPAATTLGMSSCRFRFGMEFKGAEDEYRDYAGVDYLTVWIGQHTLGEDLNCARPPCFNPYWHGASKGHDRCHAVCAAQSRCRLCRCTPRSLRPQCSRLAASIPSPPHTTPTSSPSWQSTPRACTTAT